MRNYSKTCVDLSPEAIQEELMKNNIEKTVSSNFNYFNIKKKSTINDKKNVPKKPVKISGFRSISSSRYRDK